MSKRRKYLAVALLVGVAVAGSIASALAAIGQSAAFPFKSVTAAELARGGVRVSAATPPADLPTTAAEAAAAVRRLQGRRVLEVRYVRCVDSLKAPTLDQDCWAVSIDRQGLMTPDGPGLAPSKGAKVRPRPKIRYEKIRYDLAFVDADTGNVIEARLGS